MHSLADISYLYGELSAHTQACTCMRPHGRIACESCLWVTGWACPSALFTCQHKPCPCRVPASMAGWHSCSGGLSPIIAPVPGIGSTGRGVADGYTRSSEMYSGAPTWRGVSNGYVAYMCGGSFAGDWAFQTSEAAYLAERARCAGIMVLKPLDSGAFVYTGSEFIAATPSISCGHPPPSPPQPSLCYWRRLIGYGRRQGRLGVVQALSPARQAT